MQCKIILRTDEAGTKKYVIKYKFLFWWFDASYNPYSKKENYFNTYEAAHNNLPYHIGKKTEEDTTGLVYKSDKKEIDWLSVIVVIGFVIIAILVLKKA